MGIIRNPSSRYRAPSVTTSAVGGQPGRFGHLLEQEITLELSHVCPNKPRQCQLSSAHNGDVALIWDPSRQVRGSSRDDDSREANNDHEQAATAPGSLVGRRAIAWYEWPESDPPRAEWMRATVVKCKPRVRSELKHLLHYDVDGEDFAWDFAWGGG